MVAEPLSEAAVQVRLGYACGRRGIPGPASFRRWVGTALEVAGRSGGEVCIRIVDAAEGRRLNREYRGKDQPTNVLSFPAELPDGLDLPLLGDLVLCAPLVHHEAMRQGKRPIWHWAHLCIHGSLHLLGYDHQDEASAATMESLEIRALAGLGIADPYG